jgi:NAD+ diphosphatase
VAGGKGKIRIPMVQDNLFAGPYLERRPEARLDPDWIAAARGDADTLHLLMWEGAVLMQRGPDPSVRRLALVPGTDARVMAAADPARLVLLGWYEQRRCVLVDLTSATAAAGEGEEFAELRPLASELPAGEAGLAAYARALHLWRASHRFCGRCAAPLQAGRAGHLLSCPACGQQSFPRIDPAIIVLAHAGERALLGRQASWPAGRYSTIAGFVEPGESLEDAVRRELLEETGIVARQVRYQSSQPWPFPSSLMLGFIAAADHAPPQLHDGELEDARWFSREELRAGAVLLPPRSAISRRLIEDWLQGSA